MTAIDIRDEIVTMNVRPLDTSHAAAYRELMLEGYDLHPEAFTAKVEERAPLPLSWWETRLQSGPLAPQNVLAGVAGDQLAGVAGLLFEQRPKTRHIAMLYGMYVRRAYRGSGLGEALVLAALDAARARPEVRVVQLTVTEGNQAAQALYERCGFASFGVEPFAMAVGGGYRSKVHMWQEVGSAARTEDT